MTSLAEIAKASWGERSASGSKGVIDNPSYDKMVSTSLNRRKAKTHQTAGVVGAAGAVSGVAFPHGGGSWKRRAITGAVEGLGGAGAVEGVHAATRKVRSNKMATPEYRGRVERGTVNRIAARTGGQVNQAKWGTASKADDDTKRKEQAFGLANNAFGATAGAIATRSVYRDSRKKHLPGREAKYQAKVVAGQQKASDKAAARYAAGKHPFGPVKRAAEHIGSKIPAPIKRYAAPAAVAGAVGMQVANAGADAQSAQYFARELAAGKKKPVAKAERDHVGRRIPPVEEVSKRRFDSEADRQHRLGIYEGLGVTGAIAGAAGAGLGLKRQGVKLGNVGRKLKKHRLPLAAVGASGASGATAVAARRAYTRDRNEAWT